MGDDHDSCLRRACSSHLTARSSEEDTTTEGALAE